MKFLNNMKLLILSVSALVLLSPSPVNAAEPETGTARPDATETVSGNDPVPPSKNEPEQDVKPDVTQDQTGTESLIGQAMSAAVRLENIERLLESLTEAAETISENMEKYEENHDAYFEKVLEKLYMDERGSGIMLLSDDEDYYWLYLSDYYNNDLGFVVLPNRGAFEYYWSRSYYYVSKSDQSWYGMDYIIYRDEPYLMNTYGYDIETYNGAWSEASNGCYVETVNLSAYEASIAPVEPDPGETDPDESDSDENIPSPSEFYSQLEVINETLTSIHGSDCAYYEASEEYRKDMHRMQSAETASSIILCILACVVVGIMLFTELFRRFK